jgi:hypothetical protein
MIKTGFLPSHRRIKSKPPLEMEQWRGGEEGEGEKGVCEV